ncbi:MAG: hypothetical protein ACOYLQ_06345 [Hyphomicrobiaceae bacterium]
MTKFRAPFAATVAAAIIATLPGAAAAQEIRLAQAAGSERVPGGVEHRPSDGGSMAPGSATDGPASRSATRRSATPPTLGATGGAPPMSAPAAPADTKKAPKEDTPKK